MLFEREALAGAERNGPDRVISRAYSTPTPLLRVLYIIQQAGSGRQESRRVLAPGVGAAPAQGRMRRGSAHGRYGQARGAHRAGMADSGFGSLTCLLGEFSMRQGK